MSVLKPVAAVIGIMLGGLVLIEAMGLLILQHNIAVYKRYWDMQNARQGNAQGLLYIALGDSAAQGIGASSPLKGYVGLVAAEASQAHGRPVHIVNLSVTGAKISDVINEQLPRLQKMQLPQDTIVTMEAGANDLVNFDPKVFSGQMEKLLSQLPPQTVVADMPYFGGGRAKKREADALQASRIIKNLAAKYNLRIAPLHDTTKHSDSLSVYAADFFHPNDKGYKNWYQAFAEILFP